MIISISISISSIIRMLLTRFAVDDFKLNTCGDGAKNALVGCGRMGSALVGPLQK